MAQITVDPRSTPSRQAPAHPAADDARTTDAAHDEERWQRLRSTAPVAVAVSLLFGVVMAAALALRQVVDLGVFLLTG